MRHANHRWIRQSGESAKAFDLFSAYLDLGLARSVDTLYRLRVGSQGGRAPRQWFAWSSKWEWVARAAAYDAHLEAKKRKAQEDRLCELARRRVDYEFFFQDLIEDRATRLRQTLEKVELAPVTDVTRKEDEEVTIGNNQITRTRRSTKVKGILLSGYARANQELRDTAREGVLGPRPIEKKEPPPVALPPFVIEVLPPDEQSQSEVPDQDAGSGLSV